MKSFRDPVYDYIDCNPDELLIVDSPWFQRLRHCSQNGPARLVYPTLVGSRFEHSLGVMHLAEKMLRSVLNTTKRMDRTTYDSFLDAAGEDIGSFYAGSPRPITDNVDQLVHWLRLAGLCHDLGHFPLSHTLESVFDELYWDNAFPRLDPRRACHEVISAEIVRQIALRYGESDLFSSASGKELISKSDARAIILLLLLPSNVVIEGRSVGRSVFSTLHEIIVGTYDADRLDYLQRDSHLASANIGLIDIERFLDSLRLVSCPGATDNDPCYYRIRLSAKAISAVETILIERYKQKKWVHYHHKVVFYDRMAREAGMKIFDGVGESLFTNIEIADVYPDAATTPGPLDEAYSKHLIAQLSGQAEEGDIGPLSIYTIGDGPSYSVLDCAKLVNNPTSHFIDDIWFSQQCRERLESPILSGILVDRRAMGVSLWKRPDMFDLFWATVSHRIQGSDAFWEALELGHCRGFEGSANVTMRDRLTRVFRDESGEYLNFIGKPRSIHLRDIELYLTDHVSVCSEAVRAKMAYVRWKNLFFDVHSDEDVNSDGFPRIYGSGGKEVSLKKYSGLIESLIGLRGETLFYIYLVGNEAEILKLNETLVKSDMREKVINEFAGHFADVIIESLSINCKVSRERRRLAVRTLSAVKVLPVREDL